jgi:hypothetical protein
MNCPSLDTHEVTLRMKTFTDGGEIEGAAEQADKPGQGGVQ